MMCVKAGFGEYFAKVDPSVLFQIGRGEGASPFMAMLRGTRIVNGQEPEVGEQMPSGQLKKLAGSQSMSVRALYGSPVAVETTFKVFICANEPRLSTDKAARPNRAATCNWTLALSSSTNPFRTQTNDRQIRHSRTSLDQETVSPPLSRPSHLG